MLVSRAHHSAVKHLMHRPALEGAVAGAQGREAYNPEMKGLATHFLNTGSGQEDSAWLHWT